MKIYFAGNPGSGNGTVVSERERSILFFVRKRLISFYDYLEDKAIMTFNLIKNENILSRKYPG